MIQNRRPSHNVEPGYFIHEQQVQSSELSFHQVPRTSMETHTHKHPSLSPGRFSSLHTHWHYICICPLVYCELLLLYYEHWGQRLFSFLLSSMLPTPRIVSGTWQTFNKSTFHFTFQIKGRNYFKIWWKNIVYNCDYSQSQYICNWMLFFPPIWFVIMERKLQSKGEVGSAICRKHIIYSF